jgi:hypothetical protein
MPRYTSGPSALCSSATTIPTVRVRTRATTP